MHPEIPKAVLKGLHGLIENAGCSATALNKALVVFEGILENLEVILKAKVQAALKEEELPEQKVEEISKSVKIPEYLVGLTVAKIKSQIRKFSPVYVSPVEVKLGHRIEYVMRDNAQIVKKTPETCQYFPIIQTCLAKLKDPQVFKKILDEKPSSGKLYCSNVLK